MPATMRLHVVRDAGPERSEVPLLLKLQDVREAAGQSEGRDGDFRVRGRAGGIRSQFEDCAWEGRRDLNDIWRLGEEERDIGGGAGWCCAARLRAAVDGREARDDNLGGWGSRGARRSARLDGRRKGGNEGGKEGQGQGNLGEADGCFHCRIT